VALRTEQHNTLAAELESVATALAERLPRSVVSEELGKKAAAVREWIDNGDPEYPEKWERRGHPLLAELARRSSALLRALDAAAAHPPPPAQGAVREAAERLAVMFLRSASTPWRHAHDCQCGECLALDLLAALDAAKGGE